ncbi:Na+/H+ antiporter NhaC [Carnobacterium pleistocenium]|uniref:Na+/H+ antiporter NhaC n=1 Tax=Carnobacterium pleistocenium TaxID=181073 RepID=UPI0005572193|nr:Na+/H+ antiporter NhaC [Carnobacterium pleistocenium]
MKKLSIREGFALLILLLLLIGVSIIKFNLDPQTPLLLAITLLIFWGKFRKYSWDDIHKGIQRGVRTGIIPMIIFILIGALISIWIAAGIIPSMMVIGFKLLNPSFFIPSVFLICAVVGTSIGSAFTTVSTIGLAFLGMGTAMGFTPGLVAGAIVSGSVFGDKMSPLSDSTNLSAAVAEVDLFRHIKNLMWTTIPSLILSTLLFLFFGMNKQLATTNQVAGLTKVIESNFQVNWLAAIPIIFIFIFSWKRIPAIPTLLINIVLSIGLLKFNSPNVKLSQISSYLQEGYISTTGNEIIDALLSRGGVQSMMWSISLIILALALGGLLMEFNIIDTVMSPISNANMSTGRLILVTALSAVGVNALVGEQYLAIVLPGNAFKKTYKQMGLSPLALSRVLEDAGAVVNSMIPWGVSGVFISTALGVPTLTYLPYAFFCLLCPVLTVVSGFTNIGIKKLETTTL